MAARKPLVLAAGCAEIATGDTLLVPGRVSGAGAAAPTASIGTVTPGSTDWRGSVSLPVGTLATTITFSAAFTSAPFVVACSSLALAVGAGVPTKSTVTLTSVSSTLAQTLTWMAVQ